MFLKQAHVFSVLKWCFKAFSKHFHLSLPEVKSVKTDVLGENHREKTATSQKIFVIFFYKTQCSAILLK